MSTEFSKEDPNTGFDVAILAPHHKIHEGDFYFVKGHADIANGADLDFLWIVPDTTEWPHVEWSMEGEGELTLDVYEAVATTNDGALVTTFNANRNSLNEPTTLGYTGPTLDTGALGDDGNGGTLVWSAIFGSGGKNQAAAASRKTNYEFIGKRNTKYWFRIHNASGGELYLDYSFDWYEQTNEV